MQSIVILLGQTGVGKTKIIETLYSLLDTPFEVVSADSMQIYRSCDIAFAKPSKAMCRRIPHHLLDIRNIDESYSVANFVQDAENALQSICSRNHVPIITGGTAYYLYHFLYGLPQTPPVLPSVRTLLQTRMKDGIAPLYEELLEKDPVSAQRIKKGDSYRIVRALEVWYSGGKPLSEYASYTSKIRGDMKVRILGLLCERKNLYHNINMRTEAMFEKGLVEEVASLVQKGAEKEFPAMRGIGYKEFFEDEEALSALKNKKALTSEIQERIMTQIQTHTRRYAKRQGVFFQKFEEAQWHHPSEVDKFSESITSFLRDT